MPEPNAKPLSEELAESRAWWQDAIAEILKEVGEGPHSAKMGSFCVQSGHKFLGQEPDEEVVLLLRAHPITNISWVLLTLGMLFVPYLVLQIGILDAVPAKFIFMGQLTWYLVTLMYAFEKFLFWYYSVFIITNNRLVDIDFENLTYRRVTYANLDHIEEPEMVTGGFIRSLFQYGDVMVTTASEHPTVSAPAVPWPQKVVDIISRLSEELEKRRQKGL